MAKELDNSQVILNDVLAQLHKERAPELTESSYFEIFCAEQILKSHDLSYEEIQAGIVDGEHDGGVDGIYSFVNGELVDEDFDPSPFKKDVGVELHLIQAKTSANLSEAAIDKLVSITRNLLDLNKDVDSLVQFNSDVREKIKLFRTVFRALAARFPSLVIKFYLASKRANLPIPQNFVTKSEELKSVALGHFSEANLSVEFLGAAKLLDLARKQPKTVFDLKFAKGLSADNGAIVLCTLGDFNKFLRDDSGKLRKEMFDSNVRDFQGTTEVNAAIRETLDASSSPDFWWLNNGVTILSSKATINGDIVSIADPQIVNGLQTSTQISLYFDRSEAEAESRSVMIKVISPENEETRDKIIKATNSQNAIQPAALRATDKIQRDIEATLRPHGLYYDRRKNYYKNEGKPADKIVSIPLMAQVLMSILLGRPDDARARPSSLIKDDAVYCELFSESIPIQVYSLAGVLIKKIEAALLARADLTSSDRNNIRFYVAVYLISTLTKKTIPSAAEIARLEPSDITEEQLTGAIEAVKAAYVSLGATDQIAKGQELKKAVRTKALASHSVHVQAASEAADLDLADKS